MYKKGLKRMQQTISKPLQTRRIFLYGKPLFMGSQNLFKKLGNSKIFFSLKQINFGNSFRGIITIRPSGTPFEDGIFKLEFLFSNQYPSEAPKVKFLTKMFHPNSVYSTISYYNKSYTLTVPVAYNCFFSLYAKSNFE